MRNRIEGMSQPSGWRRCVLARLAALSCLAALSIMATASPTSASVTLGQLGNPPDPDGCATGFDWVQPSVTSGNSYAAPEAGTLTSWSANGTASPGKMLGMKVFRKDVSPDTYRVVSHEGPHLITPSALNTFPVSIPVQPGDLIGLSAATDAAPCDFSVPGETDYYRTPVLADGASGSFTAFSDFRLNVTAVLVPTNTFTLGDLERNKKKGTATLTLDVPNPGELALSGKGVKSQRAGRGAVASKTITAAGTVELLIKAKGKKKKRKLNKTGKVMVNPKVTYTPTGGDPSTQSKKLKLKKRLKNR